MRTRSRRIARRWTPLCTLAVAAAAVMLPTPPALAQKRAEPAGPAKSAAASPASPASAPSADDQAKAQQHFQRAKDLYQAGSYREAVAELEIARALDPKAKDLVMNLGILHEKLGKYDAALGFFKAYLEMDGITAAERTKAEGIIKRIEGAKKDAPPPSPPPPPSATVTPAPSASPPPSPPPPPRERGRVDGYTIAAGTVGAVGLVGGAVIGVFALSREPTDFVTGRDGSFATLQKQETDAHTIAIVADIALGVGVIGAAVTALLYFGRSKDPPKAGYLDPIPRPAFGPGFGAATLGGRF